MPLPDERPRQSVANLIGRFEQQTKRQSLTGTSPPLVPSGPFIPRATSVASNHTGDAAKEEVKEKREWPPKASQPPPATVVPDVRKVVSPIAPPPEVLPEPVPVVAEPAPEPEPEPAPVETPSVAPELEAQSPQSPISDPIPELPAPTAKSPVPPKHTTTGTPSKSKAGTPSKVPAKSTRTSARSPPTSFHGGLNSSVSTPPSQIKPSPSASARAAAAASRPRPSSSASNRPPVPAVPPTKAPSTPARSKTPSSQRPKTPSSVKSPNSGLFAPTAASLARARNAPSPVPTIAKRRSLGPDVAERLSKPTASSISKARAPTSPVRGAKAGSTPVKAGKTAVKGKVVSAAGGGAKAKVGGAKSVTASSEEEHPEIEDEHLDDGEEIHGDDAEVEREGSATTSATLVEAAQELGIHEVLVKSDVHEDEEHLQQPDFTTEPRELTPEPPAIEVAAVQEEEPKSVDPATTGHAPDVVAETAPAAPRDDLDDIVNMLESKPLISAQLTLPAASPTKLEHAVDIDEIPDIDED
ncbi:hypothetical protein BXZ70DRAFT_145088 [Cristinia sonorae]|uniref:Uncharacterized protein n=1 Tax=Cristinia sonorae TaxID=1940300 RepID=A0A8K0UQ96_9AGAR|nr:hypothetical protein BXZ70DRAFT_145088 [Cristinia sonorae]